MTLQLLDPAAVAQLLDCTEATAEDRLRDGTLPGIKIGRSWRVPADALAERLRQLALEQAAMRRDAPAAPRDEVVVDMNGRKHITTTRRRQTPSLT